MMALKDYLLGRSLQGGESANRRPETRRQSHNCGASESTLRRYTATEKQGEKKLSKDAKLDDMTSQSNAPSAEETDKMKTLKESASFYESLAREAESEKEKYMRKVQRRDETIATLESNAAKACSSCKELPNIEKQLVDATEEAKKLKAKAAKYWQASSKLNIDNQKLVEENGKLTKQVADLQASGAQRMKKAYLEIDSLQQQLSEQERLLKQAQEDVYNAKDVYGVSVESDADINGAMGSLERAIKGFCKQYAIQSSGAFALSQRFDAGKDVMEDFVNEHGLKALSEVSMDKKAASMLLTAWLTQVVYANVVTSPWFFLGDLESALMPNSQNGMKYGLQTFLHVAKHCYGANSKSIDLMSSEAYRLLGRDRPIGMTYDNGLVHGEVKTAKFTACANFATRFLDVAQKLLATSATEKMFQDLLSIMTNAAVLSEKLHIQRCSFFVEGRQLLGKHYDSNSAHMEAHNAHIFELEDDERYLDGKSILLVSHPEVYAIGSSDGSDTTTKRVLKKAVVWMEKQYLKDTKAEGTTKE